jgi:uncharacterized membrane protein
MTDLPPPVSPTPPAPNTPARRGGRGLKLLLAVSLALNLAVAGIVAGMALRGHSDGRGGPVMSRDLAIGPFSEALTRDQRHALLRSFALGRPDVREIRAEMRADFDAILAALRSEPFDAAAFRAAVEGQNGRMAERAEAARLALVTVVEQMSDAERAAFVDKLEASVARRGARGMDGKRPSD